MNYLLTRQGYKINRVKVTSLKHTVVVSGTQIILIKHTIRLVGQA